jgi:hypothetical protein
VSVTRVQWLTISYVTESVAKSEGLASVVNGAVIMRANSDVQASGRGRDSVRIASKDEWADVRPSPTKIWARLMSRVFTYSISIICQ